MLLYRFRLLDKFGRSVAGEFIHCPDDDAARRHSVVLARQNVNHSVEILQADRSIGAALMPAEECRSKAKAIREMTPAFGSKRRNLSLQLAEQWEMLASDVAEYLLAQTQPAQATGADAPIGG